MGRDSPRLHSTVNGRALTLLLVAMVLASCSDTIAPAPDGLVWLRACDVGRVTEQGLSLVTRGDEFCPRTVEVDAAGVIWGAEDPGEVRLVAGNRWVRIPHRTDIEEEGSGVVIDLAIGTDGRVWLATGSGGSNEYLDVVVQSFNGETWRTYAPPSGSGFGTVVDRFEPPQRILAPLPRSRMALVTSEGLFLYGSGRWVQLLAGDFSTAASTPDGSLWIAGLSGVYMWSSEDLSSR